MTKKYLLSPYRLAELYNEIWSKSVDLQKAARRQATVDIYTALDNLDLLRRRLEAHYLTAAVASPTQTCPRLTPYQGSGK